MSQEGFENFIREYKGHKLSPEQEELQKAFYSAISSGKPMQINIPRPPYSYLHFISPLLVLMRKYDQDAADRDNRLGKCFRCNYEYNDSEVVEGKGVDWGKSFCPNCGKGDSRHFIFCQIHPNEAPHHPNERCEE